MSNNTTTTVIIKNANFKWAKLDKPVNPFGSGDAWEIQIYTEDMDVAQEWQTNHINIKTRMNEDGVVEYYANIKRWARSPKTNKEYDKPLVIDALTMPLDPSIIGNGSKGAIKAYQYPWSTGGKNGISTVLVAVKVEDLVEYHPETVVDF